MILPRIRCCIRLADLCVHCTGSCSPRAAANNRKMWTRVARSQEDHVRVRASIIVPSVTVRASASGICLQHVYLNHYVRTRICAQGRSEMAWLTPQASCFSGHAAVRTRAARQACVEAAVWQHNAGKREFRGTPRPATISDACTQPSRGRN